MKVVMKYFGEVAEKAMKETELLEFDKDFSSSDLRQLLEKKYQLQGVQFSMAVNREIKNSFHLKDNDEIALLPPFAGG